jgi:chemosensory pili system protein ChpA (sensor histidine kinase/response regulator)
MKAERKPDLSALNWIRGDLDQTLHDVRTGLEAYLEGDQAQIQSCIEWLHHVHGVLDVAQVYGGAMLAGELEQVATAWSQGRVRRADSAAEAMMLGIAQLPAYLEKLQGGAPDVPVGLMSVMNDLRAARDAPLVTETSLFAPKLNAVVAAEPVRPGSGNRDLPRVINQQRAGYHRNLLGLLRGQDFAAPLRAIRDVLDQVNSHAGTARLRRLLDAAEALCTALVDDETPPPAAVKSLFGHLDRVFKQIIDQGEEAAMMDFPVDLLKNLLFYVSQSTSQNPSVLAIQRSAGLSHAFPVQESGVAPVGPMAGTDREMFNAVAEALGQDLRDVKDQLDLYMRGDRAQTGRLTDLAPMIQRIGDTLGMVGRGDLRTRLKRHGDELGEVAASGVAPADDHLMALAGDLLRVESSLDGLGAPVDPVADAASTGVSSGEIRSHMRAAIDEAAVELAQSKEALLQFLASPEDASVLREVPERLKAVAGAMQLLAIPEAAAVLQTFAGYVTDLSEGREAIPDAVQQDAIADTLVGSELYMRSLVEAGEDPQKLLRFARGGLVVLGHPLSDEAGAQAPADEAPAAASILPLPEVEAPAGEMPAPVETEVAPVPSADGLELEIIDTAATPADTSPEGAEAPLDEQQPPAAESASAEETTEREAPLVDDAGFELEIIDTPTADEAPAPAGEAPAGEQVPSAPEPVPAGEAREAEAVEDSGFALDIIETAEPAEGAGREVAPPADQAPLPSEMASADQPAQPPASDRLAPGEDTAAAMPDTGPGFAAPVDAPSDEVPEDEIDPEILEVFTEEAVEELEVIQRDYPRWRTDPGDADALATIRRSFHTLKGSGRIVGAQAVGEFSWAIENLLNRVIDGTVQVDETLFDLMDEAVDLLPQLVEECQTSLAGVTDIMPIHDKAFALATGVSIASQSAPLEFETETEIDAVEVVAEDQVDESILTDTEAQDSEFADIESSFTESESSLFAVYRDEAAGHVRVLGEFIDRCRRQGAEDCVFDPDVRRAMHTLRGSANAANATATANVAEGLEKLADTMLAGRCAVDAAVLSMLERSHAFFVAATATAAADTQAETELRAEIDDLRAAVTRPEPVAQAEITGPVALPNPNEVVDQELLEVFLDEGKELLEAMEAELGQWRAADTGDLSAVASLQRTLHTMKGGSRMAGVVTLGDLSHAMESVFQGMNEGRVGDTAELRDLVRHAADRVGQDIDVLLRGDMPQPHQGMIDALEAAAHGQPWELSLLVDALPGEPLPLPDVEEPEPEMAAEPVDSLLLEPDSDDSEAASGQLPDSELSTDSEPFEEPSYLLGGSVLPQEPGAVGSVIPEDSKVVQFPRPDRAVEGEGFVPRRPRPQPRADESGSTERVRVASESLDQMVNNAGEVSIYRARIEQQNNSFAFNLGELGQTIDRLRGQLRDLEIETEAQILSRHEREGAASADFDPLELDRYSTLQQLSRALSETVEDLSNLGQSLTDLSRDTDTLLLQQARITTDLQDSLLRTRMVRFASRVPRLERVVRQTAHSIGKDAVLKVHGGHEDMDRAILERMMGPLEHLLRNAVSHGIEDENTRLANGKAKTGVISLAVAREGSDVVLTLADDGAGLDKSRIRAKAVQRGLLAEDARIADDDVYQLILQPGFSTAEQVSQVSGRGVGMDVVLTEVKQLGGTLEIDSEPGRGSSFTIRLPFTLAITDSLLVTLGDDIYAVPHSSMDGVVRIAFEDLRAIYDGQMTSYEYAGRKYTLRYLGTMLGTQLPHLTEAQRWYPLLLVRSGEHRVAIQVDSLMGNRQIVVKSVGAQLSTVRWFTGGTILADGQIALILDMNALVRADSTQLMLDQLGDADEQPVMPGVTVMVVDDSITVRKVTSRLLERHNMQVITAKDGVDAVSLLQEHKPNVVLLDIEMPRMDGYELARHMRSTLELSHIPIIMITSRSGDKHRNRAFELGVKRYLGKPYQEAELLENIYAVLADATL